MALLLCYNSNVNLLTEDGMSIKMDILIVISAETKYMEEQKICYI